MRVTYTFKKPRSDREVLTKIIPKVAEATRSEWQLSTLGQYRGYYRVFMGDGEHAPLENELIDAHISGVFQRLEQGGEYLDRVRAKFNLRPWQRRPELKKAVTIPFFNSINIAGDKEHQSIYFEAKEYVNDLKDALQKIEPQLDDSSSKR